MISINNLELSDFRMDKEGNAVITNKALSETLALFAKPDPRGLDIKVKVPFNVVIGGSQVNNNN
ncbi:hypothetical protein [Paenibacillus polymyxa]|jgi:hypothetical protein|uniref:hypothetical protein n=1 Tax=Paenibacillus polymyxa TaxID=1406 RepID=UPI00083D45DB|nr:hypothetical protein [Paenibacillus polymyxa]ODB65175.1 hypothetical protein A7309_08680 [Paenibacillus polymyxa]